MVDARACAIRRSTGRTAQCTRGACDPRLSEGYGLAGRTVIRGAAQPSRGDHMNRPSDQFGHFVKETADGEDGPVRLDLDEEVNVAVGPGVPAGTEPNTRTCPMPRRRAMASISGLYLRSSWRVILP